MPRMDLIIPIRRKEPFDDPAYLFELKLDGFRGLADTVQGRMLSKNLNPLKRFRHLLDALPPGYVFDGEIVVLDEDGRPAFNDLLFGRREPSYVAFDVLFVDGGDERALPLKERRALLEKVVRRYGLQKRCRAAARRRSGRCAALIWRGSWRSGSGTRMARERNGGRS
jgi:bifunctional non-homologous end joining protein LigD